MGLIILGLLYVSLRRLSDVAIVVVALGVCVTVDARIHWPYLKSHRFLWIRHHRSFTILESATNLGSCIGNR